MIATVDLRPTPRHGAPASAAISELEALRESLLARPQSLNPHDLPAVLRDPILKALGERGDDIKIGMLPRGSFSMLRKGSVRFDEKEAQEREDFIYRYILLLSQSYLTLYRETASAVYRAEIEVDDIIDVLKESIKILEDDADSGFTKAALPDGADTLSRYKKEAEKFRDNELREYREKLEGDELPSEKDLGDIKTEVENKMGRFNGFAKKAIISAGKVLKNVAEAIASGFTYVVDKYTERWRKIREDEAEYQRMKASRPYDPHDEDTEKEEEEEKETEKPGPGI